MPTCSDIDSSIADEFDNVTYVRTIEYNGEYIVAMMTTPFFGKSSKNMFVNKVKTFIYEHYGVNTNNIKVVFDIEILHLIKHASTSSDVEKIFKKVRA